MLLALLLSTPPIGGCIGRTRHRPLSGFEDEIDDPPVTFLLIVEALPHWEGGEEDNTGSEAMVRPLFLSVSFVVFCEKKNGSGYLRAGLCNILVLVLKENA